MNMKKSILFISLLAVMFFSSCASKLDVTPPNSIYEEQIKDMMENGNDATKQKILAALATPMVKYFNYWGIQGQGSADPRFYGYQGLDWCHNLMANDVVLGYDANANSLAGKSLYDFTGDYNGAANTAAFWFGYAYSINQANMVLGYFTKEAAASSNLFKDGRARALLVRAYNYLCLQENFQDAYTNGGADKPGMSLYTDYNPLQEAQPRSSSKATYEFIIADLQEAVSLLKAASIGYTDDADEDLDLGVANFLLARAALEFGDYATCATACNEIISSGKYSFIKEANYGGTNTGSDMTGANIEVLPGTNAFCTLDVNPEVILGFSTTSSYNASAYFTQLANPFGAYASGRVFARIDDRLYNKINDNDFRKDAFYVGPEIVDYVTGDGKTKYNIPSYTNLKFAATTGADGKKTSVNTQCFVKFRFSEVYLMLAEAQLASNQESAAKATLNTLLAARTKAGATTLTVDNYASSAISTQEMVRLQWRIEMWCEGGREYMNNKRWNIPVDRSNSGIHVTKAQIPVANLTLQLPQREIEDNPKTTQNK